MVQLVLGVGLLRGIGSHADTMVLALVLWLCSLPLVVFIVAPLLGLTAAAAVALAVFFVALVVCWRICTWEVSQG